MDLENSQYDRARVPESSWPDGSPVSNWSKAVAALRIAGSLATPSDRHPQNSICPLNLKRRPPMIS